MITINDYPVFMIFWNLFLLIIPFFLCKKLIAFWRASKFKTNRQKLIAIFLGLLWLVFISNSAYIITDVRHLLNYCPMNYYRICADNAWMIMFFFTYASLGWLSYVYLLNQMKFLVKEIGRQTAVKIYILAMPPLISLGVLLGLIHRWNSWDIFIHPLQIFYNLLMYFTDPVYFFNWAVFTVFLYILYFGGNFMFKQITHST